MSMPLITDVHLSTDGTAPTILFPGQIVATAEHDPLISQLRRELDKGSDLGRLDLADGTRWRVQRMREGRYALRSLRTSCPELDTLGLPLWIKGLLLNSKMRQNGGLVLIFGLTGAGKTVTFSATIRARLLALGGYALTLEDPPEDPLEGHHGAGYCEQLHVRELGGWENAIPVALRCFPAKDSSMLGFGEVLNDYSAAHLFRLAGDGHLVFATVHAKSIAIGLERLAAMAYAGGERKANELLANALQLAVHQRFDHLGKLQAVALERENKVTAMISRGDYSGLGQEVEQTALRHC
ncbi:ATPase, T2SS/T4P/T4SS family [Pseudomonas fulva]|uniref:ATPase, T2SS/T4P/T4SS family n=1 Tax=Pseudomonas fulva TaxID=47880 RepID=UPI002DB6DA5C|nr:ATPase, T2SS/T4P/T4SS family [Pseudomonas fulva]MEB8059286.1 Flp pilus assembly complex ATPase component TadA [Pseudomonas fulva]